MNKEELRNHIINWLYIAMSNEDATELMEKIDEYARQGREECTDYLKEIVYALDIGNKIYPKISYAQTAKIIY